MIARNVSVVSVMAAVESHIVWSFDLCSMTKTILEVRRQERWRGPGRAVQPHVGRGEALEVPLAAKVDAAQRLY